MLRFHTLLITADQALKQAVRRLGPAIGSAVECVDDPQVHSAQSAVHLLVIDARKDPQRELALPAPLAEAKRLYLVDGMGLLQNIKLLAEPHTEGVIACEGSLDEEEFIATATKALRSDLFGLQKYFPWGVTTYSVQVQSHEEKDQALGVLLEYARVSGCRGSLRDRIQLVCDELMMNALYHAPVGADGRKLHEGLSLRELTHLPSVPAIQVQYGCSGRHFGIAVRDGFGSLSRDTLLEYLKRAQTGAPIEDKALGAGLGLVSVLRSVSRLIFNIETGGSTEVIGLFDRELFAHGKMGARSVQLFTAAGEPPPPPEQVTQQVQRQPSSLGGAGGKKLLAAALLLLCGLSTLYAAHKLDLLQLHPRPSPHARR